MTLGIRSSGLRFLAASVACVPGMAGRSAAGPGAAPAAPGTTVAVDGNSAGRVFDGAGGLSAGAPSAGLHVLGTRVRDAG